MERDLLILMPPEAFLVFFVLIMLGLTSVIFISINKFFPHTFHGQRNTFLHVLIQVVGLNYVFLIGFTILTLWNAFDHVKKVTALEANHLSLMLIESSLFPLPIHEKLSNAIGQYIQDVIHDEWKTMKRGQQSEKAFNSYSLLIKAIEAYTPQTSLENTFYKDFVKNLNEAYGNRRLRITILTNFLIPPLFTILILNVFLIVCLISLIENKKYYVHFLLTLAVSAILFLNIGLALLFKYPFSAGLVSSEPFTEGFLARFKAP